jgi:hypothetical protein
LQNGIQGQKQLVVWFGPRVPGEIMPLVEEVNKLLLRLRKMLDFQKRFIADATH